MNWWQNRDIKKYSEVISKINNSTDISKDCVEKCDLLFKALNNIWSDFYLYKKTNNSLTPDELRDWSDHKAIIALFQSLEKNTLKIVNSIELLNLVKFSPKIMNHNTLKKNEYDPSNISAQLENKAQEEHEKFINSYKKFQEEKNNELPDAIIKKLAQLLYVVRSNIAHGEKTPKGPDKEKVNRDKKVCEIVYPILYNIVKEIFDNPNRQLILYGTMRRGAVNNELLKSINGKYIDGKIEGTISIVNSLPYFEWETRSVINDVEVFTSDELENHWDNLDRFEGDLYKRIWIPFKLNSSGFSIGNVYIKNN